jgi:hypothetical protein
LLLFALQGRRRRLRQGEAAKAVYLRRRRTPDSWEGYWALLQGHWAWLLGGTPMLCQQNEAPRSKAIRTTRFGLAAARTPRMQRTLPLQTGLTSILYKSIRFAQGTASFSKKVHR